MLILRFMVVVASASLFDIAAQAQTVTMGETAVLSDADSKNGNLLVAQQATLTQSATIRSMAFYVTSADGQLVLGIYDATGPNGIPGHLVAQTAAFTPATGWNTSSTTTTPTLTAGKYWLVYLPSSDSLSFVKENTTGNCRLYSLTFTATLPQTYKRNPRNCTPTMWSLYATLSTTATPTLSLTDTPVNPTVMDSAPPGTQVTSLAAAWSDGSTFTGGYSFTDPYNNDNNLFTLNNNAVVVNGSLAQLGGKPPQNISVVAQQGSTKSNFINVPVAVTTSPPPPPPPPPGNDPTSGVLPPYNDAYANWGECRDGISRRHTEPHDSLRLGQP